MNLGMFRKWKKCDISWTSEHVCLKLIHKASTKETMTVIVLISIDFYYFLSLFLLIFSFD